MFNRTLPLKTLTVFCRSLGTLLETGVSAKKAFQVAGEKAANPKLRRATYQITQQIESGSDISTALEEAEVFPELMIGMVGVAEQTGALPEILSGLGNHYENLRRMRKNFLSAIAWPVFQFFMAVFVIAGLILLLGVIGDIKGGGEATDMLGWGLLGVSGALTWLGMVFGTLLLLFLSYQFVKVSFAGQQYMDRLLMRLPILGKCMQSFAIARFSWSYHLTQEAGMPVDESMTAAMRATSNGAFIGEADRIIFWIKEGRTVTDSLRESQLFPNDVIEMIHVGETSGTVPEMLHRLGPQFEEQANRSLETLAAMLGWLVWCLVAGFIIYIIFSIMLQYIGIIEDLT